MGDKVAYIKRTNIGIPEQSGTQMLGSGTVSNAPETQQTAAGSPSGWTNIQDYLGANKQTPVIQGQLEGQLQGDVKKAAEATKANMVEPTRVQSTKYNQDTLNEYLKNDQYDKLRENTTQAYKPQTINNPSVTSEATKVDPQSFQSIMSYFEPQTQGTYTGGEKKLDELFLRGAGGGQAAGNIVKEAQQQYNTDVVKPAEEWVKQQNVAEEGLSKNYTGAATSWEKALNDFLVGQNQGLDKEYNRQENLYTDLKNNPRYNVSTTPTRGTAATSLGYDINDYNAILDIINETKKARGETPLQYESILNPATGFEVKDAPYTVAAAPEEVVDEEPKKFDEFSMGQGRSQKYIRPEWQEWYYRQKLRK